MDHLFFFLPVSLNNYSSFCGLPWFYFNVFSYYFKLIPNNESFQCTFSFIWRHWWALDPPHWDNLYIHHSVISVRACQLFWTPFSDFFSPFLKMKVSYSKISPRWLNLVSSNLLPCILNWSIFHASEKMDDFIHWQSISSLQCEKRCGMLMSKTSK